MYSTKRQDQQPDLHFFILSDGSPPSLSFKATLAYRNKQGPDSHDWQFMYTSLQERPLVCEFVQSQVGFSCLDA